MLVSQKEERDRRFSLALRAGIPVFLVFLVFYTTMIKENKNINDMEVDYKFSILTDINNNFEKNILQFHDIIGSQNVGQAREKEDKMKDAKELSTIENCVIHAIQKKDLLPSFRPLLNTYTNSIDIYEIAIKLK